ncbi:MAG TPA: hypothetical protein VFU82_07055, partial [Gammaproteobacteria bacterium]|nr:hypothetical protein [Gammaproteobacteria bacterium]
GSSGGGLFDSKGNLIGITTASKSDENAQNINFALPTEMIEAAILEPTIDSMIADQSDDAKANTPTNNSEQIIPSENDYTVLGTYGKDRIVLAYWYNRCYILIPGRYNPNTINSVAVWIPSSPNGLLILSRITSINGVFKFIKWFMESKNVNVTDSKSYLFYGKTLERLGIISINGVKQPAYLTSGNKPYTESLISEDGLIGQFYNYSQTSYDGLTSITFGLSGFTDALDSYNENCVAKR